jgi:hypothetical protein
MTRKQRSRMPRGIARIIKTAQAAVLQLRNVERAAAPRIDQPTVDARVNLAAALYDAAYPAQDPEVCCGHGPHGGRPACCVNAGRFNEYANGDPRGFYCPEDCSCHD